MLARLNNVLEQACLGVGAVLFAVFIVVVFFQVLARNYLNMSVIWTDEVAVLCFIWSVFLGAAVAVRRELHYVVIVVPERLVRGRAVIFLFADLAMLPLIYVMATAGWDFVGMGMRRLSTALGIPLAYAFSAIPIGAAAMALFTLELLIRDVRALARSFAGSPTP